tara:strand:+ start:8367 stop:8480 length:114 start_codon:yes stop_codon:yes gene_type:complete
MLEFWQPVGVVAIGSIGVVPALAVVVCAGIAIYFIYF